MATVKERISKDGKVSFLITVTLTKDGKRETVSETWFPASDAWSAKTLDKELEKEKVLFERKVRSGEIQSKKAKMEERRKADAMPSLVDFLEKTFIPSKKRVLANSTIDNYSTFVSVLKDDDFGKMKLADIRPIHINNFMQRLLDRGNIVGTVNNRRIQLNVIFEMAVELELIENNPVCKTKPLKMSKQEKAEKAEEVKAMSEEETKRFLAIVDTLILVWQVFFRFLLDSACRIGEARGLKWSDIDFATKTVTIQRQLLIDNTESTTKNGKSRKIVLSDRTIALLRRLKNESIVGVYVFANKSNGRPFTHNGVYKKIKIIGEQINCPWLHPHSLRHTSASLALAHGASLSGISKKLGHANTKITAEVYLHADDSEAEKTTLAIASIMN